MKYQEMYPSRFVRGQDLRAAILARINAVETETVHPRPGITETKYVLRFDRLDSRTSQPASIAGCSRTASGYGVLLRPALAAEIFEATRTDDTADWIGKTIVLEPTHAQAAGREVTTVSARAPKPTAAKPTDKPKTEPKA